MSKTKPIPILEPLVSDIKNLRIGDFLKSNDFKRQCIFSKIESLWADAFNHVKANRRYYSMDSDHDYFDSIDTMVVLLNHFYETRNSDFYKFLKNLLLGYTEWAKSDLKVKELIKDIELLSPPEGFIGEIELLGNYYSKSVPEPEIPDSIWNAEKLDSALKKMDASIKNNEFNLTLTYAYSSLEGLYKCFIKENIPGSKDVNKLNQLAKIVRDHIGSYLTNEKVEYSEQIINLIPTITNAISNARNNFSDSHFDGDSEKWLAEFSKDCVNSIGRLIIKFIKRSK